MKADTEKYSVFGWKRKEGVFVFLVIGLVIGVSYFQLKLGEIKARDAQRKADVEMVARGLANYFEEHDIYPLAHDGNIMSCGWMGSEECVWGEGKIIDEASVVYLERLPRDPFYPKFKYVYEVNPTRQKFRISIALENRSDPGIRKNLTSSCGEQVQCLWYVEP